MCNNIGVEDVVIFFVEKLIFVVFWDFILFFYREKEYYMYVWIYLVEPLSLKHGQIIGKLFFYHENTVLFKKKKSLKITNLQKML